MPTERFDKLSEQKRKKICEAVINEFQRKDYGELHMTQIARHARISRGSLYTYFRDKEDMLYFSLQQTRLSIWNHDRIRLTELSGDYLAMEKESLDYHFSICRTNRLYQLLYLPIETVGLPLQVSIRFPEGAYREFKGWIYSHVAEDYKKVYTQEEFDVLQETCNDILKVSIQEYLTGTVGKDKIEETFSRKLAQLDRRGARIAVQGGRR